MIREASDDAFAAWVRTPDVAPSAPSSEAA